MAWSPANHNAAVLADNPIAFFNLDGTDTTDLSGNGHTLTYNGGVTADLAPNGTDNVALFDGSSGYAEVADADDLSVPGAGGILTWEMWLRPDTLEFPGYETSGDGNCVYPLIKGENYQASGDQEYQLRLYSLSASRPNRFSAYAFNPEGGLGAGSYFEGGRNSTDGGTPPLLAAGDWVHVAAKIDTVNLEADGWGTIRLYRNGVLMDHDSLGDPYFITPENKGAPLHLGARPGHSWFQGAIESVAVYGDLSDAQIAAHYDAMVTAAPDPDPASKIGFDLTVLSNYGLTVTTPPGVAGPVDLVLTDDQGTTILEGAFTYE